MYSSNKLLFIIVFMLSCSTALHATHPFITDDTGTQGKGGFEIESSYEYKYNRSRTINRSRRNVAEGFVLKSAGAIDGIDRDYALETRERSLAHIAVISLAYGVIDDLDIQACIPYQRTKTKSRVVNLFGLRHPLSAVDAGLTDLSVAITWNFWSNDRLGFALKPGISIPTGDESKGLGSGMVGGFVCFVTSIELAPLTIHMNLGYRRSRFATEKWNEHADIYRGSIALECQVVEGLRLVLDTGLERNPSPFSRIHPAFILGGVIYSPWEKCDLDLGFKYGITGPEADYAILAGLTFRI
ncbi:MAG: transporter [Spirochaetes bacterium]|nr:transporter [Spirochaetota bacterium]